MAVQSGVTLRTLELEGSAYTVNAQTVTYAVRRKVCHGMH